MQQIQANPLESAPADLADKGQLPYRDDWFSEGQKRMADAQSVIFLAQMIGKLFNLAKKIAENNPDSFTQNSKYTAFAKAYKESLKIGKHGGKIPLPKELHKELPTKFHRLLRDTDD